MITAVIAGLKEKNGSSKRVEGIVNIPFDLNFAGSRRRHGRPPKPQPEPVQNDVPVFVHGVQNSMAAVPFLAARDLMRKELQMGLAPVEDGGFKCKIERDGEEIGGLQKSGNCRWVYN
ncbi:Uncharacterized protein Fot_20574 [Forsythia ovata]|uniref:Uncharacterized protein n=1 Tax=Forsythia ovata TaxID=205694 RepID=A0ABD1UU71_9LAMI